MSKKATKQSPSAPFFIEGFVMVSKMQLGGTPFFTTNKTKQTT